MSTTLLVLKLLLLVVGSTAVGGKCKNLYKKASEAAF
jgi:hypothetical protein